jgi:hypothetical protein
MTHHQYRLYEGVSKSFRTESMTKSTTTNTRWEATQRVMAAKLTRLTHKIAIQLHLVTESCTIRISPSRQPVRKLLDTPSYIPFPSCEIIQPRVIFCRCSLVLRSPIQFCTSHWSEQHSQEFEVCSPTRLTAELQFLLRLTVSRGWGKRRQYHPLRIRISVELYLEEQPHWSVSPSSLLLSHTQLAALFHPLRSRCSSLTCGEPLVQECSWCEYTAINLEWTALS